MVLGILLAGVLLGLVAPWVVGISGGSYMQRFVMAESEGANAETLDTLDKMLADGDLPFEDRLEALAALGRPRPPEEALGFELVPRLVRPPLPTGDVAEHLASSPLDAEQKAVALGMWNSLGAQRLTDELSQLAERDPPVRYANHAIGVFLLSQDSLGQAARAFEREGKLPTAKKSRKLAATIYVTQHDVDAIERLLSDPLYADDFPTYARMELAAAKGDWWTVWRLIPKNEWERVEFGPFALALFTGCCWFVFSLQAGQAGTARGTRTWMCFAAVVLGALSIWPTHWLILWQEEVWSLQESENIARGIYFFVLGVGLREEFSKLLLFLPLLPLIVRRGVELEALIVAACVGLGFATMENSHYFAGDFGTSSVGRFLTANFFHMAATGLVGLAVYRGIQYPKERGPEALAIFGVIVLAHGLYDAMGSIPVLMEYSIASMIIYVFLAYQFFHELRTMRIDRPDTVSLTANFLCGVSLVTAVTFVYLSGQVGPRAAAMLLGSNVLSMAVVAYMFLREMPSSLVAR